MKSTLLLSCLLSLTVLHAQDTTAAAQIGEKLSNALIQKLSGELKAVMSAHGPVAALGFCSANAIKLTNEISDSSGGYTVKRVSLKERNSNNIPNKEESALLKEWETLLTSASPLPPYVLKPSAKG